MRFHSRRYAIAKWLDDRFPRACWVYLYDWSERKRSMREALRPRADCLSIGQAGPCWCGKRSPRNARTSVGGS